MTGKAPCPAPPTVPPRVLVATQQLGAQVVHGTHRVGLDILAALTQAGVAVSALSFRSDAYLPTIDDIPLDGVHVARIHHGRAVRAAVQRHITWPALAARVRQDLRAPLHLLRADPDPDLILINGLAAAPLAALRTGALGRCPRVLVVHSSPRHAPSAAWLRNATKVIRDCEQLVFVSARGMREWQEITAVPAARCRTIRNCVGERRTARALAQPRESLLRIVEMDPADYNLVCVATIQPRKGQDVLVRAAERLQRRVPRLKVHLIGPTPPSGDGWGEALRRQVQQRGLEQLVRFRGPIDDPCPYMQAADAVVLPSRAEAFPLTTLEAMALGRPVIASRVDGVEEQITDGEHGLLVPVDEPDALAAAIAQLHGDPVRALRLGTAAQARYRAHFSRARFNAAYAELVIEQLAKHLRSIA